jgi:kynureninase
MTFDTSRICAIELDKNDKLSDFRNQFHLPLDKDGKPLIYFCGNSLGLQPKTTAQYIRQELEDWKTYGVEGHFHAKNPWMPYHEFLTEPMARILGAKPTEVVVMNTLTVNLHLMMVSFYKPNKKRTKIVIESNAFPSDQYAVKSQLRFHGLDHKKHLIELKAKKNNLIIPTEEILDLIEKKGETIATILLGAVNYYTGQLFELEKITKAARAKGILVGLDLAHAAGNVTLNLHDWGVDFAITCGYKYLNGGPGGISSCYIHERHHNNPEIPRFEGWWGQNKATRFIMGPDFDPIPTAEAWQLSNAPIMSMACLRASLEIFDAAGFQNLRSKSELLTSYLEYLLCKIRNKNIEIITPTDTNQRGAQLSIRIKNADKSLYNKITEDGVICDWRSPDVIRVAPVPLYNSFMDCFEFVGRLSAALKN